MGGHILQVFLFSVSFAFYKIYKIIPAQHKLTAAFHMSDPEFIRKKTGHN